MVGDVVDAYFW